ncbi:hypothetical protein GQ43DRAFT_257265 [Delitschia confertaspora ATCC 74209]|uniref:Zn(2)-C6 fungal-type domain-containing protein n=1 Tax=Delitschia confertaspora ATCC 74209 TaxID=1513339 RepID=A0A9P4MKX2_9PLEO|nr:hypothetical protein GQ43DRAFT_257265 [Delitschia confertaspora ATCC 74209]
MLHGLSSEPKHAAGKKATEQQLNRACEACRTSKVRCLPNSGSSQCQRCAKAGKTCLFAPPAKRRQRKRTDVRVAELEREVRLMRSLLKSNRISPVDPTPSEKESGEEDTEEMEEGPTKPSTEYTQSHQDPMSPNTKTNDWMNEPWTAGSEDYSPGDSLNHDLDIIDRGLLHIAMADELLDIYRNELVHHSPQAVIPKDWSASKLRTEKPGLFHAVMAAASHSKGSALSNRLHDEVISLYAKSCFIKGERSLQYIQALLVTVAYYTPPSIPAHLQIFQFGNMAAGMAFELGLAYKPRTHEQLPKRAIKSLQRISSTEELLENCRTILMLYIVTAGFATRLRRPNILLYNSWMEECHRLLTKSPRLDDKRVIAWLNLQKIADEGMSAFGFDDASTSFSLSELRLQVILRVFERRMEEWKKSTPPEVMSLSLMMEYHQNEITMWEFGMDGGRYDAPTFRNTHLSLPDLYDDCVQPESLLLRSPLQLNATMKCIGAAHDSLDCFLQIPVSTLQTVPNVIFVRALYAIVLLLKVDYAVGADGSGGGILDSQSLKVDLYLNSIIQRTAEAVGPQRCRVPAHWLFILKNKVKAWHDEHQVFRKEAREGKRPSGKKRVKEEGVDSFVSAAPNIMAGSEVVGPSNTTHPQSQSLPPTSSTPGHGLRPQPQVPTPNFGMNTTSYSNWMGNGATATSLASHQQQQQQQQQQTFLQPSNQANMLESGIPDYNATFQNGEELYFFDDVDYNYGAYVPQGDLYTGMDMQFAGGF